MATKRMANLPGTTDRRLDALLTLLAETPGLPNAELARKAFVTPQSMNEVLKQLEASGLVEREQSPSNARILNAHLTHAGLKEWRSANFRRPQCWSSRSSSTCRIRSFESGSIARLGCRWS